MVLDDKALDDLARLADEVDGPWHLIPWTKTRTGTVILHDSNHLAIADLFTAGPATAVDKLIAIAPDAIASLVREVRSLRAETKR